MPIFVHGDSKDKLTILYYVKVCGLDILREQLYRAMVENDCMSYFAFEGAANELEEDGYIAAVPKNFGQVYRVTVRGEQILDMFSESLPYSLRERLKNYADANREPMRKEMQLVSAAEPLENGGFRVRLKAREATGDVLEIVLSLASRDMMRRARANWPDASEDIYLFLLEHLLKSRADAEQDAGEDAEGDGK